MLLCSGPTSSIPGVAGHPAAASPPCLCSGQTSTELPKPPLHAPGFIATAPSGAHLPAAGDTIRQIAGGKRDIILSADGSSPEWETQGFGVTKVAREIQPRSPLSWAYIMKEAQPVSGVSSTLRPVK